jgi:hypothetical protein
MPIQVVGEKVVDVERQPIDVEPPTAAPVPRLLAPDVLLPTQMARSSSTNLWLRRLYGAILEDALECLDGRGAPTSGAAHPGRERARRRQQAWEWIMSEAETCFAFLTLCSVLGLDSAAVRAELRRVTLDRDAA